MEKTIPKKIIEFSIENNISKIHQLSPYLGKIRPDLARHIIKKYCPNGGTIFDPFCGSGTIPFEASLCGNKAIATDLNPYAITLTLGKLNASDSLSIILKKLEKLNIEITQDLGNETITPPLWVSSFFHPSTLLEIKLWSSKLIQNEEWFILSSLLGILHHQRPGFLSYPSSHGAPYLRDKKFPKSEFPEMYEYRSVFNRLVQKITRVLKGSEEINIRNDSLVLQQSSYSDLPEYQHIDCIITSPPYMKSLSYARDNRLRLWVLGYDDWQSLDKIISPSKIDFKELMKLSFSNWSKYQETGDKCVIIIGDIIIDNKVGMNLSSFVIEIANTCGYELIEYYNDPIPESRKIMKGNSNIKSEDICVFIKL